MELKYSYLVVLTALCVVSLVFTLPALVLNQWLRYTLSVSRPGTTVTTKASFGLTKADFCTTAAENVSERCVGFAVEDIKQMAEQMYHFALAARHKPLKEDARTIMTIETESFGKLEKDLNRIKILIITGFVLETCGFLLSMAFWKRSFKRWAHPRKYLSATAWLIGSILYLAALFVGLTMNKKKSKQLPEELDLIKKDNEGYAEMVKAWGLLYTGICGFLGIATAVFVLLARCCVIRGPNYGPLSVIENLSLEELKNESVKESVQPLLD